jgi:Protein of unknown function (DUF3025)
MRDSSCDPFGGIDWSQPWLLPLRARAQRWASAARIDYPTYLGVLNGDALAAGLATGRGKPLSFIAQDDLPAGASYEGHIAATGCVPTRHNLHDFFNGSMWFQLPRIKAALNLLQASEIEARGIGPTRGAARDALTLFDENAVLFASADPGLGEALRSFDWRTLFIGERAAWGHRCEARVFGHALLEKLLAPYKACTGHAWIVEVEPAYFAAPEDERRLILDEVIAASLLDTAPTSRRFAPLPVLGVPGWWPPNQAPSFYDDARVFRAGRRS